MIRLAITAAGSVPPPAGSGRTRLLDLLTGEQLPRIC